MYSSAVDPELHPKNVQGEPDPKPRFEVVGPKEQTLPLPFIPETPKKPVKQYGDQFWTDNVEILWSGKRWKEFFPREQDTYEEKLNSVMRATLYISLVLIIMYMNLGYIWVALGGIILTIFLYENHRSSKETFIVNNEELTPANFTPLKKGVKQYVEPTPDNPMMNVDLTDYRKRPNRESLSKIAEADDPEMKKAVDSAFYDRIFRDVSDVYSTVAAERNFYTVPVTTIPNDQKAFAEFCYGTPPTCKEGNGFQCMQNTDREDYLRGGSRPVQL